MKLRLRQAIASTAVFGAVLTVLVFIDDRVRERFGDLLSGGNGVSPLGDRVADLSGALAGAARTLSFENVPLLVFAFVGAVLVLFMLKT